MKVTRRQPERLRTGAGSGSLSDLSTLEILDHKQRSLFFFFLKQILTADEYKLWMLMGRVTRQERPNDIFMQVSI